ncbi:MAG: hypothetical protein FJZ96_04780 [Chloroflexi bacterium]|nr:hypothetical protein [Chloroflexota bacterium]
MIAFKKSTDTSFVKDCLGFLKDTFRESKTNLYREVTPELGVVCPHLLMRQKSQQQPIAVVCIWKVYRPNTSITGYANFLGNLFEKVIAITAESRPMELPFLVWGTPGIDATYHVALPELKAAIQKTGNEDQMDMLASMIDGQRLRDISDLPFDLAV